MIRLNEELLEVIMSGGAWYARATRLLSRNGEPGRDLGTFHCKSLIVVPGDLFKSDKRQGMCIPLGDISMTSSAYQLPQVTGQQGIIPSTGHKRNVTAQDFRSIIASQSDRGNAARLLFT